jgi:hypothetical protein
MRICANASYSKLMKSNSHTRDNSRAQHAILRDSAALKICLQGEENAQAQHLELNRRQAEMGILRERNRLQIENVQNTNRLQLEYKEKSMGQDLRVVDATVEAERRMHEIARMGRREQEALDVGGYHRNLELNQSHTDYTREESRRLAAQNSFLMVQAGQASWPQVLLTSGDESG